jgi:hypothetical protein
MSMNFSYNINNKKVPIKRNTKFFGCEDFDLELEFAKEYIEEDANQTVILYRIDLSNTKVNDIYKEAKKESIRFLPPIELPVVYEIDDAELKSYGNRIQKGVYSQIGKLKFSILLSTLEEYDCDISRGDYIGIQIDSEHREYFVVTDDGRVRSMSNKFTLYGGKPYARQIEAASVDINEFNG